MLHSDCKIGCILLAAGSAARFGSNKLLAAVEGRPLIERALSAAAPRAFYRRALVTQYPEIAALSGARGFVICMNTCPELGQSHSIRLGMDALPEADGLLFLVADQPFLRAETVQALAEAFRENPERIVAPACRGMRGNPVLFPKSTFPALRALSGDVGGRGVIRAHEKLLLLHEVEDARELQDVDTPEDFGRLF